MASQFDIIAIAKTVVPDGTFITVESEPPFAKSVRDASVLIQANKPATYDRLQRAVIEAYQRVYGRIASKKITNFDFIYSSDNAVEMLKAVGTIEEDSRMASDITTRYSSYSGFIASVVRRIAAAELIRAIPLNSSLKFKEDSDTLAEEAYADLDRILEVVARDTSSAATQEEEKDLTLGQATVYLSYELNKAKIPASAFDVPDPDTNPPTYLSPVQIQEVVDTVGSLQLTSDQRGFCHIYMTAQAYNADVDLISSRERANNVGTSAGVSLKIEKIFEIRNTDTIDSIINTIASEINSETLNAIYDNSNLNINQEYLSNIIVGAEYNPAQLKPSFTYKKVMHPEETTNEKRIATFDTYYRTNKLSFETRRNSTKVDTELLTIGFYHRDETTFTPPTPPIGYTYTNDYSKAVARYIRESKLGIPGLIYGKGADISEMKSSAPVSLFLNVTKGNVAAVSIDSNDGTTAPDPTTLQDDKAGSLANQIDTYYFHVSHLDDTRAPITPGQPVFPANDNELVFRISTSNYINEPSRLLTVSLANINYPPLNPDGSAAIVNYIGEDIAGLVVDALYEEARTSNLDTNIQSTNILGAQLGDFDNYYSKIDIINETQTAIPIETTNDINEQYDLDCGRIQIVAFRYREQEYKAVIDVIKIPRNLWIATGNYQQRRTIWEQGRRRSISIETKDLKTSAGSAAEVMTDAEILNSVNASVSQTEARKSTLLQSVYDKKRLLRDLQGRGYTEGYYRRPQTWLR